MSDLVQRIVARHLAAALQPGDKVEVTKGKERGLTGVVTHTKSGPHGNMVSVDLDHPVHKMMGPAILEPGALKKVGATAEISRPAPTAQVTRPTPMAAEEAPPDPEEKNWNHWEKRGEWNLNVYQQRSRWGYFMKNPKGGGGGSSSYPSMKAAIAAGMHVGWSSPHINPEGKDKVWLTILKWDATKEDWAPAKSSWMDVPEHLKQPPRPPTEQEKWDAFTR